MTRYVTSNRLHRLRAELTERDWQVVNTVGRMRVASASQLKALHLADVAHRHAQRTLTSLVRRRVLARLPRMVGGVRGGSAGHIYTLDVAGQHLVGLAAGKRPERPRGVREAFLAHSLAVTDVYVRLVLAERVGALEVRRFSAEPQSWRICYGPGGVRTKLKPDAYVVLAVDGYEDHWFIEVDLGTERAPALGRKCALYRAYWQSGTEEADGGVFPRVLWLVRDERRAEVLREVVRRQPGDAAQLFDVALIDRVVARVLLGAAP